MGREHKETYEEYKKRVMDPISPSFCAAKWKNATIFLNQGKTMSCHHPNAHSISKFDILWDPSAIHNTRHKKDQRRMMLQGVRPPECEYCWTVEDIDNEIVSDRTYKTVIYSDEEIEQITKTSWKKSVNPSTLELSFSNACNFSCSYCNSDFSTSWGQDLKKNGSYKKLITRDSAAFEIPYRSRQIKDEEKNPYIKAFWRWFPSLSKDLTELRITGGEPLLHKDVWELFDRLGEEKNRHIRFAVNSNLGVSDKLVDRLIEKSKKIDRVDVYTSNESIGAQSNYIRDGIEFEKWRENCLKIIKSGSVYRLHIMMTMNALCLDGLTDLFDEIISWKRMTDAPMVTWTLNILRFPAFMSVLTLPEHIRKERADHLQQWLNKNFHDPVIQEHEIKYITRLIQYLGSAEKPHGLAEENEKQVKDFKQFFHQYDQRRGKDFSKTFQGPLADWYESLPL